MELRIYFMSGNRITLTVQEREWPALRYELAGIPEIDYIEIRDDGMYVWSVLDREELEVA